MSGAQLTLHILQGLAAQLFSEWRFCSYCLCSGLLRLQVIWVPHPAVSSGLLSPQHTAPLELYPTICLIQKTHAILIPTRSGLTQPADFILAQPVEPGTLIQLLSLNTRGLRQGLGVRFCPGSDCIAPSFWNIMEKEKTTTIQLFLNTQMSGMEKG